MPTNIICLGDSITAAGDQPDCDKWTGVLQRLLDAQAPGECKVYNRGIGGQTSGQGLERIFTDVTPLLPGIVLVEFGFNDAVVYQGMLIPRVTVAEFKLKMREIARIVTAGGGQPVFIVNHVQHDTLQQGNDERYEDTYARYEAAIRELLEEIPVPGIDLPRMMEERHVDLTTFLNPDDGIHLTQEGNRIYGEMVFEGLQALVFTSI
ncbi:MAG: SGNH/GDSL hydrolase family protein [Armatimonadota bacterium]